MRGSWPVPLIMRSFEGCLLQFNDLESVLWELSPDGCYLDQKTMADMAALSPFGELCVDVFGT